MDNKKIEVEFSVKDNLTKKLKSMSDEVKNMAKEIQSSVRQIENSFNNINIKTDISSKVKSINNQMKQIGKDIGDVEVDIKAKIDESGLGGIDLGDLLSTGSMLGASSEITNSSKEMATSIDGMSKSFGKMFDIGIKNTDAYQQKIGELKQVFEDLKIATSGELDAFDLSNLLSQLEIDVSKLTGFFDSFSGSITSAKNSAIALRDILDAIKNISDSVDWKNIEPDSPINLDNIQVDYNKIEEVINTAIRYAQPDEEIKISTNVEEAVNTANKIAEMAGQITEKEYVLKINTENMESAKTRIEELKNSINDFNKVEISGKINKQEKELNGTANVINRLKKEIKDLNAQSNNMKSTFDGLTNSTNKVNKSINGMTNSTSKLKSAFGGIKGILGKLGLLASIAQLVSFGKASIETASDLEEVQNVVDVVFGSSSETVNKWAKEISGAFGLTELEAKKFSSTFGSIFSSSGVDTSYIDDMSMKLSQLAGDMASFYNISQQDAFEKLKSGIVGSVEPLQALGINLNVASLEAYALSQGITTSYSSMSEADKQILRYNYLLQQTAMVQGDYARTSGSFANQVRNLSNSFSQLKAEVGTALMSALAPVIEVISTIIQWLTALMQIFNSFLRSIGLIKGVSTKVGLAVGGVSNAVGGVANAVGDVADSLGGVGDSADSATQSIASLKKEIKGLMGMDELNVLPEPDSMSGSSGSGAGGSGAGGSGAGGVGNIGGIGLEPIDVDEYTSSFEDAVAKIRQKIEEYLGTIDFEPLKRSFKDLLDSVKPILKTIGKLIKWFMTEVLEPLGKYTIEKVLPNFFDTLSSSLEILSPILDSFVDSFIDFWDEVLEPILKWDSGEFADIWEDINDVLDKFGKWVNGDGKGVSDFIGDLAFDFTFLNKMNPIGKAFSSYKDIKELFEIITKYGGECWDIIKQKASEAWALIKDVWDKIKAFGVECWEAIKEKASDCWQWIQDAFGALSDWFKTTVIEPIKNFFSEAWNKISELASKCWSDICSAWQSAKDWFNNNVLTPIKNFFSTTFDKIKTLVSNAWTNICNIWKVAKDWFNNNVLTPIKNVFTSVWDNIKQIPKNAWTFITGVYQGAKSWFSNIFDGVKTAITSKFDAVKTKVSSVFENVKNTVSNAIEKIKGFFRFDWSLPHIKLPHFSISGSANPLKWITEGVPKISVSWYADGGIMTKPSLFGINGNSLMIGGEAGAEAIVPLDLLWNNMDKFAEKIVSGIINSQSQDINLRVDLDGKQVASSVIKNINRQTKLNGRSPLK